MFDTRQGIVQKAIMIRREKGLTKNAVPLLLTLLSVEAGDKYYLAAWYEG
jgi:hypothetical protein